MPTLEMLLPVWLMTPLAIALVLAAVSLILEDGALALGVLAVHHNPDQTTAIFCGLFGGIVLGDLLLYGAGRWLQGMPRVRRWLEGPRIAGQLLQMQTRMWPAIILCRAVPVSRLPTFTAAGVLQVPFLTFALVISFSAFIWVGALLYAGVSLVTVFTEKFGFSGLWLLPLLVTAMVAPLLWPKRKKADVISSD